jgi:nucleotide-binding universal stress UspA family protein
MRGFRKVLIAVNGSIDVLTRGVRLAHDERSWVTVVKVLPPYEGDLELTCIKNIGDVLSSEADKAASEIADRAHEEKALIKTRLEEGVIHEKIVEVAEEERCDLIIMGPGRKSLINRLLGGGVVEKVIKSAPCPVLVLGA